MNPLSYDGTPSLKIVYDISSRSQFFSSSVINLVQNFSIESKETCLEIYLSPPPSKWNFQTSLKTFFFFFDFTNLEVKGFVSHLQWIEESIETSSQAKISKNLAPLWAIFLRQAIQAARCTHRWFFLLPFLYWSILPFQILEVIRKIETKALVVVAVVVV